jgi:hypothetical protein
MSAAGDYERLYRAWWRVRDFLAAELSHTEFLELLNLLNEPLAEMFGLRCSNAPAMAFDARPRLPAATVMKIIANYFNGRYSAEKNRRLEAALRLLTDDQEGAAAPNPPGHGHAGGAPPKVRRAVEAWWDRLLPKYRDGLNNTELANMYKEDPNHPGELVPSCIS